MQVGRQVHVQLGALVGAFGVRAVGPERLGDVSLRGHAALGCVLAVLCDRGQIALAVCSTLRPAHRAEFYVAEVWGGRAGGGSREVQADCTEFTA